MEAQLICPILPHRFCSDASEHVTYKIFADVRKQLGIFLTKKLKEYLNSCLSTGPPPPSAFPGTDGRPGARSSVEDHMVPARHPRPCLCAAEAQGVRFKYNCTGADICMAGRLHPLALSHTHTHRSQPSSSHTHTHTERLPLRLPARTLPPLTPAGLQRHRDSG